LLLTYLPTLWHVINWIVRHLTVILLYLPCRRFRENGVWTFALSCNALGFDSWWHPYEPLMLLEKAYG